MIRDIAFLALQLFNVAMVAGAMCAFTYFMLAVTP